MDGTIFESFLDWTKIKKALNIVSGNILKELYSDGQGNDPRIVLLESFEKENTLRTKPIKGVLQWLNYLEELGIKTALITNNNNENTVFLLNKYDLKFDLVITREKGLWKPEPDAFLYAMNHFRCMSQEIISIGDSHYDIQASRAARIPYIFIIETPNNSLPVSINTDGVVFFQDFIQLRSLLASQLI